MRRLYGERGVAPSSARLHAMYLMLPCILASDMNQLHVSLCSLSLAVSLDFERALIPDFLERLRQMGIEEAIHLLEAA